MKVLLLNPPRFHELVGKNPSIIEEHRGFNPPLGLLSLAAMLKTRAGERYRVKVLDSQPQQLSYEDLGSYFEENQYHVVGITAMTFTLIDAMKVAEVIKSKQPDTIVVLGGPHTHIFPEETIGLKPVDFVIQGEGEFAFLELLEAIEGKRSLSSVSGLAYQQDGVIHNNGIAPKINDLDSIPYPDRSFLPIQDYTSLLAQDDYITTLFSSRGCPFKCTFCDRPVSPVISGFRWRSNNHVVEEMQKCYEMGIREILIYDDTFTLKKDRVYDICEEIMARKLDIRWDVRAHVNTVDLNVLRVMKKAGCQRVHYGVECGNDRMLKVIKKNTSVRKIVETFKQTREAGIESLAYFMIGLPSETISDVNDVLSLAKTLKPNYCHFTIFCPYPATLLYKEGLEKGVLEKDVWREFAKDPRPGFILPVWDESFSREELYSLLVGLYKKFYLRPGYILNRLSRIKSFGELKRKAKAGLSVFEMSPDKVAKFPPTKKHSSR